MGPSQVSVPQVICRHRSVLTIPLIWGRFTGNVVWTSSHKWLNSGGQIIKSVNIVTFN